MSRGILLLPEYRMDIAAIIAIVSALPPLINAISSAVAAVQTASGSGALTPATPTQIAALQSAVTDLETAHSAFQATVAQATSS